MEGASSGTLYSTVKVTYILAIACLFLMDLVESAALYDTRACRPRGVPMERKQRKANVVINCQMVAKKGHGRAGSTFFNFRVATCSRA